MMKHFTASPELNALREQTEALEDINKSFKTALEAATTQMQESSKNEQKNNASRTNVTEKAENGEQNEEGVKKSIRLTDADLDDYLKAGSRKNRNKTLALKNNQKILLTSSKEIVDYINASIDKKTNGITVAYGKVNNRLTNDVDRYSGGKINISHDFLEIVPYDVQHAYEEHHKAKEVGDIDLTRADFENIPDYLDDYDELLYAITYSSGKTKICVSKILPNGRVLIIETASKSRGAIQFKNAIGVTEEKYQNEYVPKYKKRNSESTRGNQGSKNTLHNSTVSNTNLTQNGISVNSNSMQESADNSKTRKSLKLSSAGEKLIQSSPELRSRTCRGRRIFLTAIFPRQRKLEWGDLCNTPSVTLNKNAYQTKLPLL